jgi:hypothetical protein
MDKEIRHFNEIILGKDYPKRFRWLAQNNNRFEFVASIP